MAAASRNYVAYEGGKYKVRASGTDDVIFTSVQVGGAGGKVISIVSAKFDFAATKLANVTAGTAAGEVLTWDQIGANNGVAGLDSGGKVPLAQLPNSIMEYQGVYNATTNTPTLANGTGHTGDVYRVSVAGAGVNSLGFVVGDYAIYNGATWEKAHSGADSVVTVNGFAGVVVLTTNDVTESVNLYYTQARFDTAFAAKSTTNLAEGTNLYYTQPRFDTAFSGKTTTALAEGTNQYFTTARAKAAAVANVISAGVTDVAPSEDAVFQALALKADATTVSSTAAFTNDNAGAITARQLVYVKANGNVDLVTAALATFDSSVLIVKDASIAAAASGNVYIKGDLIGGFTGLTPGKPLYVHQTTAGLYTQDPTTLTTVGTNVYRVGRAVSATQIVYGPAHVVEL